MALHLRDLRRRRVPARRRCSLVVQMEARMVRKVLRLVNAAVRVNRVGRRRRMVHGRRCRRIRLGFQRQCWRGRIGTRNQRRQR